jgi:hypothetical protein
MSGLRERLEALCDKAEWGGYAGRGRGALLTGQVRDILDADPAASTSDAPADTTLREQLALTLRNLDGEGFNDAYLGRNDANTEEGWRAVEELADALLPLLRAHDAQVWDEGERAGHTNANPYRHLIRNPYRDRAEQDTPDQANT